TSSNAAGPAPRREVARPRRELARRGAERRRPRNFWPGCGYFTLAPGAGPRARVKFRMTLGRRTVDHDLSHPGRAPVDDRASEDRGGALAVSETRPGGPEGGSVTRPGRVSAPLGRGGVVGGYVILSLLGTGGMGAVYAAHDP